MGLHQKLFKEIDLNDPFFNSLKEDYNEFPIWFEKKSNESAYVFLDNKRVEGFLYLKYEADELTTVTPILPAMPRIKIGTMKINPHGTRLGERFIKKVFDHALYYGVNEIYVTVFSHHETLIALYKRYGFEQAGYKDSPNGRELVLVRRLDRVYKNVLQSYPFLKKGNNSSYLLAIEPRWHTRLLPDSILQNETTDIIKDISHTNSIHKVYLASMKGMENLMPGDNLLIYRMTDGKGPAHYRAVATSICAVEEYRALGSFRTKEEFFRYCRPYSVFTDEELVRFWSERKYRHVIRFAYNIALKRRVTRGEMIEKVGLDGGAYWGFLPLSDQQFIEIARRGKIDESLIVHQA